MMPDDETQDVQTNAIVQENLITDDAQDLRTLEAALFASREPMSLQKLNAFAAHLDASAIRNILAKIKQDYDGRGITLEESDLGYAFRTSADLAESLSTLRVEERKLSRAAMETLAVIAYHQPLTRVEIEGVRGVATSKGTVDMLLETGWIKPGRRRETPGRPLTWVTTPAFLDHFGLESIVDLPGLDDLKAAGLLDRRPAVAVTADMFDGDGDEEEAVTTADTQADEEAA